MRVSVGAGQRVVPDSLQFCFELAAHDTIAANARLDVEITAGSGAMVEAVKLASGWRLRPAARRAAAKAT